MAQLTEHFTDAELNLAGADARLIENAFFLSEQLLEPVRAQFGPVRINSGYRDPGRNSDVGGKSTSYHLFQDGRAAADIVALAVSVTELFDWMRLESKLPFDKIILESNSANVPTVVHVQIDRLKAPRRLAYTGHTGAATTYTPVEVK